MPLPAAIRKTLASKPLSNLYVAGSPGLPKRVPNSPLPPPKLARTSASKEAYIITALRKSISSAMALPRTNSAVMPKPIMPHSRMSRDSLRAWDGDIIIETADHSCQSFRDHSAIFECAPVVIEPAQPRHQGVDEPGMLENQRQERFLIGQRAKDTIG